MKTLVKVLSVYPFLFFALSSQAVSYEINNDDYYSTYKKERFEREMSISRINPLNVVPSNYTNNSENKTLTEVESYIRNTTSLIDKSQALQISNERYQFNYEALKQDVLEIANSIQRFKNHNKSSQTPRFISPLTKRY